MSFFSPISAKHHYSLRLVLHLAKAYYQGAPVSLQEVSSQEKISLKYLEQLVVPLRKKKIVKSLRGRNGGYIMIKNPNKVTIRDVIWLYSDNPYLVDCLAGQGHCYLEKKCLSKQVWVEVQKSIENTLKGITLEDLIKKHGHK